MKTRWTLVAAAALLTMLPSVPFAGETTTTTTITTTSSSLPGATTSSSILQDYDNERMFGVFSTEPIASLTVHAKAYPDYGPDDAYCRFYGPAAEQGGFDGEKTFTFAALPKGELDRSQAVINCDYYTHEPHGPLSCEDIAFTKVVGLNSEGQVVPTAICQLACRNEALPEPGVNECREACGDAVCDGGEPKVSDALAVLKRALALYPCPLRICDVNHDGEVTAADALKVLRRSVHLRSVLLCSTLDCAKVYPVE